MRAYLINQVKKKTRIPDDRGEACPTYKERVAYMYMLLPGSVLIERNPIVSRLVRMYVSIIFLLTIT